MVQIIVFYGRIFHVGSHNVLELAVLDYLSFELVQYCPGLLRFLHEADFVVQFLHTLSVEVLVVEVEGGEDQVEHDDVEDEGVQDVVQGRCSAGRVCFHQRHREVGR